MGSMALATSISAIPSPAHSGSYTDTFDNVTVASNVASFQPVGFQNNLNYTQWQIIGPTTSGFSVPSVPGVNVHGLIKPSKPNSAGVLERMSAVTGGSVSINPSATTFKSPSIRFFTLSSFYFGCGADLQEGYVVPTASCDIAVTGYDVNGNMVGEASYSFAPGELFEVPMVKAVLPETFMGLKSFTIGISGGEFTPALTTLQIDNVTHTNYW